MLDHLEFFEKLRLVELLLACPSIKNPEVRRTLLGEMPSYIADVISESPNPKVHVLNIVNTCMDHPGGLKRLLEILRFFDGKTKQFHALVKFINNKDPATAASISTASLSAASRPEDIETEVGNVLQYFPGNLEELAEKEHCCADFIYRNQLVKKISECFQKKHHLIVLHGQTRVGKTKLLKHLEMLLTDEFIPLPVTPEGFMEGDDLDDFIFDFTNQLTGRFNDWVEGQSKKIPPLKHPDWNNFNQGKGMRAFYEQWHKLRKNAGSKPPVIICDEVEYLLDMPERIRSQLLKFIDHFMRKPGNGYFILAGSERIRFSNSERFSDMIERAKRIQVQYFEENAVSLIFSLINRYIIDECDAVQYFIALSDGHPQVLQAVLYVISSQTTKTRQINQYKLEQMVTMLLDKISDYLWLLRIKLSPEEFHVAWLISQKTPDWNSKFEYSLSQLQDWDTRFIARYDLEKGIAKLEMRGWIKWQNGDNKLFWFRLGIFPLWIRRYDIQAS